MKEIKIILVRALATTDGIQVKTREFKGTETKKTYLVSENGGRVQRISKDKIMELATYTINRIPGTISFYTYCLPGEVVEAAALVSGAVKDVLSNIKEQILLLTSNFK
jgi:hypothetical protein